MNPIQFIPRMKNFLLFLIVTISFFACSSGVEKRNEPAAGVKPKEDVSATTSREAVPAVQPAAQTPVPGQAQPGTKPVGNQPPDQVNQGAPHQTVKLHPVNRDPNDPNRNLLSAYANNKINSVVIPFQKGNDPNLKPSQDFFMSGSRKAKEGDHQGAIEDYTKSIALVKNATTYLKRGYSYLLIQDYQSALIDMNEALKMAPVMDKAYFARAVCRFELQDFKTAEEDLRKFMETDKSNALAYNYLAAIKFMQKNYKEALDNYDMVAKLDPAYPDVYTNRGMMRHNLGDLNGAIKDYDLAIKQNPSNSAAYNNKGAAELVLKDYKSAINDLDMAIKIKEDYADAYDNRGKVKIKMGDQKGACEDWQKSYSLGLEASRELIMKFCK